jgi:hypothetical protein
MEKDRKGRLAMRNCARISGFFVTVCVAMLVYLPAPIPAWGFASKHSFQETRGLWKAVCDKEKESGKSYCRIMTIDKFGSGKNTNFVNYGIAWAPDAVGLIVATYMGFRKETQVVVGVDKHERLKFRAPPQRNNLSIGPKVTRKLLELMLKGKKMVVYFTPMAGIRHLSLVELKDFQDLHKKVQDVMKPGEAKNQ